MAYIAVHGEANKAWTRSNRARCRGEQPGLDAYQRGGAESGDRFPAMKRSGRRSGPEVEGLSALRDQHAGSGFADDARGAGDEQRGRGPRAGAEGRARWLATHRLQDRPQGRGHPPTALRPAAGSHRARYPPVRHCCTRCRRCARRSPAGARTAPCTVSASHPKWPSAFGGVSIQRSSISIHSPEKPLIHVRSP